jgi:hypothetical protein
MKKRPEKLYLAQPAKHVLSKVEGSAKLLQIPLFPPLPKGEKIEDASELVGPLEQFPSLKKRGQGRFCTR